MSERAVTLIVCGVALICVWHPWIPAVGLGLWLARRCLHRFAGWARGQRLLREALAARCVAQNAAVARGDVSGIYGDFPV
jgi:hypothetical protein